MTREEADLIIAENNKSKEEILKAIAKVKSFCQEQLNLRENCISELKEEITKAKEIITNILTYFPDYKVKTFDDMSLLNALDKAQQFLKEVSE